MHTIEQLRSGELAGLQRVKLACGLTEFPRELFNLADTLEILDLSGNALSALPDDLPRLSKLRIIFCSDNLFTTLPAVLGRCAQLSMIGFKANRIHTIEAGALAPTLRWLVLTDNELRELPAAIGDCKPMEKLMLAGNRLRVLPQELANCSQLALLRALAIRSYMCVPLVARERTLGTITLLRGAAGPAYTPADLVLAQSLAQRIALALDNAQLYRAARQAVHIRDEFLSVASHELKTPITTLLLAVQAVQRITRQGHLPPPEYLTRRLTTVEDQSKRLAHLVNDLLDISRIVEGQLQLEPQAMDLRTLTQQVLEQFQEELAQAGCPVTLAAPAPVPGTWDPARIEQVLTNLLTNAMKYGRGQPITITVTREGTQARLAVRDEGIGIPREHLERIFGRFERAVAPGKYGGMGLGLYIARQIVEAHGGEIGVVSAPGQGATFTVTLPSVPAAPTGPA